MFRAYKPETCRAKINNICIKLVIDSYFKPNARYNHPKFTYVLIKHNFKAAELDCFFIILMVKIFYFKVLQQLSYFWNNINHKNIDNRDFYESLTMETITFS